MANSLIIRGCFIVAIMPLLIAAGTLELRLAGSPVLNDGRLEASLDGGNSWGTICNRKWSWRDAKVACRMLGFPGGSGAIDNSQEFGTGTGDILLSGFLCNGDEASLLDCDHQGPGEFECDHSRDAGLECDPMPSEIRLAGGNVSTEGRVEISINGGPWGTVCDRRWSHKDGLVACKQLGPYDAATVQRDSFYGPGSGPVHLSKMSCSGCEDTLLGCQYELVPGDDDECNGHGRDAGVICYNK